MLGSACFLDIGPGLKSQVVLELHVQDCLLLRRPNHPITGYVITWGTRLTQGRYT